MASPVGTVIVLGQRGAGKSTFIKEATGYGQIEIGGEGTQEVREWRVPDTDLFLVDTPGFDDTGLNDQLILEQILNYPVTDPIVGAIWVHDAQASMKRKSTDIEKILEYGIRCNLNQCCLVITKWQMGPAAQSYVNESNDRQHWGRLRDRGASIKRFNNTRECAMEILQSMGVRNYLNTHPISEPGLDGKLAPWVESQSQLANVYYARNTELQREMEHLKEQEHARRAEESAREQRSRNRRLRWLARASSAALAVTAYESDKAKYRWLGIGAFVATEMACQGQKSDEDRELGALGRRNPLGSGFHGLRGA